MKNLITKLLAMLLDRLKTKNSLVFVIIQSVLIGVFVVLQKGVEFGIFPDGSLFAEGIEYVGLMLMALIGTNTVTDLPDNYDPGNLKEFLAKWLDAFKTNNPRVFGIIQIVFLVAYGVLTYGGFPISGVLVTVLQVVTVGGIILTGSRTVKFKDDGQPEAITTKKRPKEYYD